MNENLHRRPLGQLLRLYFVAGLVACGAGCFYAIPNPWRATDDDGGSGSDDHTATDGMGPGDNVDPGDPNMSDPWTGDPGPVKRPFGEDCVSGDQCESGYCESDICCTSGSDCCHDVGDCTVPAPVCNNSTLCAGSRSAAACNTHTCTITDSSDPTVCAGANPACERLTFPAEGICTPHTQTACLALGGAVFTIDDAVDPNDGKTLCRLPQEKLNPLNKECPAGWCNAGNWTTTGTAVINGNDSIPGPAYEYATGPSCGTKSTEGIPSGAIADPDDLAGHAWADQLPGRASQWLDTWNEERFGRSQLASGLCSDQWAGANDNEWYRHSMGSGCANDGVQCPEGAVILLRCETPAPECFYMYVVRLHDTVREPILERGCY